MGKATSAYDEKRESQLLKIYREAYPHLSLESQGVDESKLKAIEDKQKIKDELIGEDMAALRNKIVDLERKNIELTNRLNDPENDTWLKKTVEDYIAKCLQEAEKAKVIEANKEKYHFEATEKKARK